MVLASTSEIYGKNTADKLSEDSDRILGDPLLSRWTYAARQGHRRGLRARLLAQFGLQVSIARLFNTVGPRQTGRYGMVVPNLVGQALRDEPLTVFGDGQQTRCFSYVGDIVPALVALAEKSEAYGQAVNLGGAQEVSILDLAERIIELTGSSSASRWCPTTRPTVRATRTCAAGCPTTPRPGRCLASNPPPRWTTSSSRSRQG